MVMVATWASVTLIMRHNVWLKWNVTTEKKERLKDVEEEAFALQGRGYKICRKEESVM